jgi:hypothetical protein
MVGLYFLSILFSWLAQISNGSDQKSGSKNPSEKTSA